MMAYFALVLVVVSFDFLGVISFKEFLFNIILNNNFSMGITLLTFVFPYLFLFIVIFLYFNKVEKIKRFIYISGNIFLILIFFREFSINFLKYDPGIKNVNFTYELKKKNSDEKRKVIWIILDGYDPEIANQIRNTLPNYTKLSLKSFNHKNIFAPARYTIDSLPSMLMGIQGTGIEVANNQFFLKTQFKKYQFSYNNTIFGRLDDIGLSSAAFSSVLEYCHAYLKYNKFKACSDTQTKGDFKFNSTHLVDSVSKLKFNGISRQINFYNHYASIREIIYEHPQLVILKDYLKKILGMNIVTDTRPFGTKKRIGNFNLAEIDFHKKEKAFARRKYQNKDIDEDDMDGRSSIFYSEIKKEINKDTNLIFIHTLAPHERTSISYLAAKTFNVKKSNNIQEEYKLNLEYTDIIIGKILKEIKESNISDKGKLMLVLSSDHWFRERKDDQGEHPSLLIAKIFDDNNYTDIKSENNSIFVQELIYKYLVGEITNHKDIAKFFKKKKE